MDGDDDRNIGDDGADLWGSCVHKIMMPGGDIVSV